MNSLQGDVAVMWRDLLVIHNTKVTKIGANLEGMNVARSFDNHVFKPLPPAIESDRRSTPNLKRDLIMRDAF